MKWVLTAYVLIWPLMVLASLFVIVRGVYLDVQKARKKGESLV